MLYEGSWFRAQETSFVHLFFHLVSSVKPDKHFVGGSTVKTKMSVRFLGRPPIVRAQWERASFEDGERTRFRLHSCAFSHVSKTKVAFTVVQRFSDREASDDDLDDMIVMTA